MHSRRRPLWLRLTSIIGVAGLGLATLGTTAAQAAPGDHSFAEARFLGGTLLAGSTSLDDLAQLAGAQATNNGEAAAHTDTSRLTLTALNAITVDLPGGVTIPFGNFIALGAVNQYAQASDRGVSRAATGAVSNSGAVDVNGSDDYPANATIQLTRLLNGTITNAISDVDIELGAISSQAALNAAGPTVTRDYSVADAKLHAVLPAVGELRTLLVGTGAGSLTSRVDQAIDGLAGPNGELAQALATVSGVAGLVGSSGLQVTITSDVQGALDHVLDTPVHDAAVSINLRTGVVEVDLDRLLQDANGFGLNNLPAGREILSSVVLNTLATRVATLLNTVPNLVSDALDGAVDAAVLRIAGDVTVAGTGVRVAVDGTLGEVIDHVATAELVVTLAGNPVASIPAGTVLGALSTPIQSALTGSTGIVRTVLPSVTTAVTSIATAATPAFQALNQVASLRGNVQTEQAGQYHEIALRLSVGDLVGNGGLATVDLARATVGPDSVTAAAISALNPDRGPLAGGTQVTITGTGFDPDSTVTFGGRSAEVVSVSGDRTSIVVRTPAGTVAGPVEVVVTGPAGRSAPGTFTYLPPALTGDSRVPAGDDAAFQGSGWPPDTAVTVRLVDPDGNPVGDPVGVTSNAGGGFNGVLPVPVETTPGPYTLVATDANDNQATTPTAVTAAGVPVISGVDPDRGPLAGGTQVRITGHGFESGSTVSFGGRSADVISVADDGNSIMVTSPPGQVAGPVDVVATNPAGSSDPGTFTYLPPSLTGDHQVPAGGTAAFQGSGWPRDTPVTVRLVDPNGNAIGGPVTVTSDNAGGFTGSIGVPADATAGPYSLVAVDANGNRASTSITVTVTAGGGGSGGGASGSGGGDGGSGGGGSGGGGSLAYTGAAGWEGALAAGVAALALGAIVTVAARRGRDDKADSRQS
ncbi:MAG: choice-of-anchor G family protein [Propionibacteriaceae bacterium]|nr:choice-of-anchor G family protein [Propionibacteriaceae bacterium]